MIRNIESMLAHALGKSMPWLGRVARLPGGGLPFWFNALDKEFAPAANDTPFEQ